MGSQTIALFSSKFIEKLCFVSMKIEKEALWKSTFGFFVKPRFRAFPYCQPGNCGTIQAGILQYRHLTEQLFADMKVDFYGFCSLVSHGPYYTANHAYCIDNIGTIATKQVTALLLTNTLNKVLLSRAHILVEIGTIATLHISKIYMQRLPDIWSLLHKSQKNSKGDRRSRYWHSDLHLFVRSH